MSEPIAPIDVLLQMLVATSIRMSEDTQGRAETGITLNVGGLLVSGSIISVRQFLMGHYLTDKMLEIGDELEKQEPESEPEPEDGAKKPLPEFIHLSDAHFLIPGHPPIPTNGKGVFWRGRISEVSGFSLGGMGVVPAPEK